MVLRRQLLAPLLGLALSGVSSVAVAQSVGLPSPRLMHTAPYGGQVGTSFPVTIGGENLDDEIELLFSHPGITAVHQTRENGEPEPTKYTVTIASDVPPGLYEARAMTRLGISSTRVFSVGTLPELVRQQENTSLQTAMELPLNSVCNAYTSARMVDFYKIQCDGKTRLLIECTATGIDSKLKPVLMIADAQGRDLAAERRHGILDFTVPKAGEYIIKVQGLTFEGGEYNFYRLAVQTLPEGTPLVRLPATKKTNSISIPVAATLPPNQTEVEPNNRPNEAEKITLPCNIAGAFYPAADVDTFEFQGTKGDVWWVEVVSERLALPTNPFVVVQQVTRNGESESAVDLAELNDLPSPVRVTTGFYSYDGPPHDVGTTDVLGKLEIKEDGVHRLQLRDLFGGTRRDPNCLYRLIIRKAEPDFSVGVWPRHFELRNGDRSNLSKPLSLRSGATALLDVVVVRKDGFDGPIRISMVDLPAGVTAQGLTVPAGKNEGTLLVTASAEGETSLGTARILAHADINGEVVERPGNLATLSWPVGDHWGGESPSSRLDQTVMVSRTSREAVPLRIAPPSPEPIVAKVGETLTIPMTLTWTAECSGALSLRPVGAGFEGVAHVPVPLNSPSVNVVVDLAALKLPAGEHVFAMYGGLVTSYRYNEPGLAAAKEQLAQLEADTARLAGELTAATEALAAASEENKANAEALATQARVASEQAEEKKKAVAAKVQSMTGAANPQDLVDIVTSEPIRILVQEAETK